MAECFGRLVGLCGRRQRGVLGTELPLWHGGARLVSGAEHGPSNRPILGAHGQSLGGASGLAAAADPKQCAIQIDRRHCLHHRPRQRIDCGGRLATQSLPGGPRREPGRATGLFDP